MLKTRKALTAAAAAAALAVSFGARAAPNETDAGAAAQVPPTHGAPAARWGGPQRPGAPGGRMQAQPAGPWLAHVLQRLHDQLKLTPEQEQAWNQARENTRHNFMAMRQNHDDMRRQMEAASQQPILDLNALQAAHAQDAAREQALRSDTEQNWITFYNGLSDPQKTLVSTEIKRQWQRMMQRGPRDGHPMPGDPRRGGMQDRAPDAPPSGDAPPPPAG